MLERKRGILSQKKLTVLLDWCICLSPMEWGHKICCNEGHCRNEEVDALMKNMYDEHEAKPYPTHGLQL